MKGNNFTGTRKLLRLFLRRDRFVLPVWVLLPMMIVAGQVSFIGNMPDWQKFIAELSANPLTSAWLGPIVPLSKEGAVLWRGMLQSAITVMIGSAFTVIRHTRTEEESGRIELILGCAVGRHSNLSAALVVACLGSLASGLIVSAVLAGGGFEWGGSLLAGLTVAASGWLFAGIGGFCGQLSEHGRGARGIVFGAYLATLIPMVVNNVGGGSTGWAWIVPQSWFRITIPYGSNNFWPLSIFVILSSIPTGLAYALSISRDLGSGLLRPRLGAAEGSSDLESPLALAWRQYKGTIKGWAIGIIFIGGSLGLITPNISDSISEMLVDMSSWAETMSRLGNKEGFVAVSIYIMGLLAGVSIYAIITVMQLRKEETNNLAESILAKPVSRTKWMSSYLIIAFAGSALLLLVLGLAAGVGWSLASGDMSLLTRVMIMSLSKIPSVWVIVSITAMLYGWLPRVASVLSWMIFGSFIVIEMFWEISLVDWSVMQLTPFAYAHYSIPISDLSLISLLGMVCLASVFTGIGLIGFRRRSIG